MSVKNNFLLVLILALISMLFFFIACNKDKDDHNQVFDGTMTDIDGNVYSTVQIGDQIWIATNLKTTSYNDGTSIEVIESDADWRNNTTGAYCWYNNNEAYADTSGALYNWYSVNTGKLCPEGWHVPSDEEWKTLEIELGISLNEVDITGFRGTNQGSQLAGNIQLWNYGILEDNSEFGSSGFTALPGGGRRIYGMFFSFGNSCGFWTATDYFDGDALGRELNHIHSSIGRYGFDKKTGASVRCLRN